MGSSGIIIVNSLTNRGYLLISSNPPVAENRILSKLHKQEWDLIRDENGDSVKTSSNSQWSHSDIRVGCVVENRVHGDCYIVTRLPIGTYLPPSSPRWELTDRRSADGCEWGFSVPQNVGIKESVKPTNAKYKDSILRGVKSNAPRRS